MLRILKILANFYQGSGAPIDDWTAVTKKNFDDFRCSEACILPLTRMLPFLLLTLFPPQSRKISYV